MLQKTIFAHLLQNDLRAQPGKFLRQLESFDYLGLFLHSPYLQNDKYTADQNFHPPKKVWKSA